ncbi:MAG: hypothetical protein IPI48_01050 [bacterium]|nr:hypothetical protein [bacterium]
MMGHRSARRFLSPGLMAALLCLTASGCGDDPRPGADFILVTLEAESTGLPVPGVKVLLMDASTNLPVAGPVVSDGAGVCVLEATGAGYLRLFVCGGALWDVHSQPDWYSPLRTNPGQSTGDLRGLSAPASIASTQLSPTSHPTATLARAVENTVVLRLRGSPGGLPRFSGTVVDSETGLPLAQAFVSLSPWTTGYGGGAAVSDDVTGPDGAFAVHDIPVAMIGDTGVGFQVLPLIVSRAGYHTAHFVHTPPSGIDHPEVSGLVVELTPLGAADNGALTGRVLRAGVPVAGLVVGLGSVSSAAKGAVGIAGRAALTGADGRFDFSGLPAGAYVVHPGFLVGDGAWFGGGAPAVDLAPGGAGDAGDLVVLHEIAPACGNPHVAWPDSMVTFRWTPVPGAARYGWFLDGDLLAESAVESVTVNLNALEPDLAPGLHAWQASAVDAADQAVGVMQNDAWFRRVVP